MPKRRVILSLVVVETGWALIEHLEIVAVRLLLALGDEVVILVGDALSRRHDGEGGLRGGSGTA